MIKTTTLNEDDRIRSEVSRTYARAVSRPKAAGGCCGGTSSCGAPQLTSTAAVAGYTGEDVGDLPADAIVNSFGCGNPLAFSGVREGDTVLDLGSGAGIDLLIAAKKVGPQGHVIGVDMTDAMIERARKNIAAAGATNVEVRKGYIEDLPVESNSVDWVISNCVINLSPNKPAVFREIARVLKPGGSMSVSDIVVERLPWWMRKSMRLYSACVGGAISEGEYLEGLREAGLEQIEVKERLVYDAAQVRAFVRDVLPDFMKRNGILARAATAILGAIAARTVAGNVWSAKFHARKPAIVGSCCGASAEPAVVGGREAVRA